MEAPNRKLTRSEVLKFGRWGSHTLEEFFWSRVLKTDGCWPWLGQVDGVGYGKIVRRKGAKAIGAHRLSWEIENKKKIPKGLVACHRCDNRICVRPDHIFIGTQSDNIEDARKKGRLNVASKGWMRNKTHCPQGHEYTPENTYRWRNHRICRTCHAVHEAKRRERIKNGNRR